jgi:protein-tyrosine phosphatase
MSNQIGTTNLWIGCSQDARQVNPDNSIFSAVVNVACDLENPLCSKIRRYQAGLIDGPGNTAVQYEIAAQLVTSLLSSGHKVLLHCHEGRSRSAAVGTLVQQKLLGLTAQEAYELICDSRPCCKTMHEAHKKFIGLPL